MKKIFIALVMSFAFISCTDDKTEEKTDNYRTPEDFVSFADSLEQETEKLGWSIDTTISQPYPF